MGTSFWPRITNIRVLKGKNGPKQHNEPIVWEQWKFRNARIMLKFCMGTVFDQGSWILWSWRGKMDQKQHNGPIVWEQWKFRNARIKLKFRMGISFWPRIMNIMVLKVKNGPKARQWTYCSLDNRRRRGCVPKWEQWDTWDTRRGCVPKVGHMLGRAKPPRPAHFCPDISAKPSNFLHRKHENTSIEHTR